MHKSFVAVAAATLVLTVPAESGVRRPVTLVRIPRHVNGFAQDRRYLAWTTSPGGCDVVTFRSFSTRRQVTVGPPPRGRSCAGSLNGDGGQDLVLGGARAYWADYGGSNLTYYASLLTASVTDPRIPVRELDFQSIDNESPDILVPPAADGRSAYWWSSPEDATPGPIVRYDGRGSKDLTRTVGSLRALAAGGGRFAYASAQWIYDCAQDPAWSPDGTQIAFASYERELFYSSGWRTCVGGLWVGSADGKGAVRIGDGRSPDWSPDGTKIAYESGGNVVVAGADGSNARVVAQGDDPAWSPTGASLAFARGGSVYVVGSDGLGERIVGTNAVQPDWSPDGTRLVFVRTGITQGIAVANADGSGLQPLTTGFDSQPNWSPDGTTIAFVHCWNGNSNCPNDTTVIAAIAPNGAGLHDLTVMDQEGADTAPAWAPDSRRFVFARQRGYVDLGDSHLWTQTGSDERQFTRLSSPRTPIVVAPRSGRGRVQLRPRASVTRLAVTTHVVAAVTDGDSGWQVEILRPTARTVALTGPTAGFAGAGWKLVFNRGRAIYVLDARRGRPRLVARAAAAPIGLSIVGRRIAWAENTGKGARVRALYTG